MKEEKVTISLLKWLESNEWRIICYDFPQSGTGVLLHPNDSENLSSKNKGGIIPDIIAVRGANALYLENKDRFYLPDFEKIYEIKHSSNYSSSFANLLKGYDVKEMYFGIGLPNIPKHIANATNYSNKIDFLISVDIDNNVFIQKDIVPDGILS